MEGHIAYIQPWPVSFKKCYIHPRVLVNFKVFVCDYFIVFKQMVDSLVEEALHTLAATLLLRNA